MSDELERRRWWQKNLLASGGDRLDVAVGAAHALWLREEEIERLRAEVASLRAEVASLRAGTIRTDSGAVIAALEAEVASLREQPRVHPLAWQWLVTEADLMHGADGSRPNVSQHGAAWDRWCEAGCPLLAEGDDATTPAVVEPS